MNRVYVAEYLRHFDLNAEDVGEVVSEGTQHYTCRYRTDQVIKIPKDSIYMRTYRPLHQQALVRDLDILNARLQPYLLPTQIHCSERGYVIIQDFLQGAENITTTNFEAVKADFQQIAKINREIVRDYGLSLDYFGSIGFRQTILASLLRDKRRALMTNLLAVQEEGRYTIKIVDVNLSELRFRYRGQVGLLHWLVDRTAFHLSRGFIRDHFGIWV
ncbi:MAG TPA: hypothetical protein VHO69_16405 [Phototrophicaceae bacterium]|nr:hypothetical protein [Phototrophicaceae bacterium]